MSDKEKRDEDGDEYVRLVDTEATTTDEDGNPRAKMEALSKGGEKESDQSPEADDE